MANSRVSLADVARRAGVSANTVSRVVRGDPEVAIATRERISALLVELNYKPNLAARALASNRTGVLHVLLAAPLYHGHGRTFLAIMDAAAQYGYYFSVSNAIVETGIKNNQHRIIPMEVDGVIIIGGRQPALELATWVGQRVPTVLLLSGEYGLPNVSTVSVDNALGARLATQHLVDMGANHLVQLAGPSDWIDAQQRRSSFLATCEQLGVKAQVLSQESWEAAAGYQMTGNLVEIPTGIMAANDQLAMGAMRALSERGIAIPTQTKIVGYDNSDGVDCLIPPLTTVAQPFTRVGLAAVKRLRQMLGGAIARDIVLKPELIIRASSRNN